jgi:DNA-binding transcriptional ArsR family regulator
MHDVFKALADPTRRRILELLREQEMTAGEIATHFSVSKPTLSGHFTILRAADLISAEKAGTQITYRLNLSVVEETLLALSDALGVGLAKPASTRRRTAKT